VPLGLKCGRLKMLSTHPSNGILQVPKTIPEIPFNRKANHNTHLKDY
jgi:hypothetical protein